MSVVGVAMMTCRSTLASRSAGPPPALARRSSRRAGTGPRTRAPGAAAPVRLPPELLHVLAELARVIGEPRAPLAVVSRLDRLEVRGERRLRVDDDVPAAGEVDDEIGAHAALVRRDRLLLLEVAVVEHAGELDHAPELKLAPAAARLRRAERLHEVRRLAADEPCASATCRSCSVSAPYAPSARARSR